MTTRGDATRAKLLVATTKVVRQVGYAHATTKAIAAAAGVAEGTIYRHFPDKASLFFAAVLDRNTAIVEHFDRLPEQAGKHTVEANLLEVFESLAGLRRDILPLELALMTDREMAAFRTERLAAPPVDGPASPLAAYLRAEQAKGRVRDDVDCDEAAVILLITLFGIGLATQHDATPVNRSLLQAAVHLFVVGAAAN